MLNERKLLEITAKIHAIDTEHGNLFSAWLAVEGVRAKLEKSAVDALAWQAGQMHPRCDAAVGGDALETWFTRGGGKELETLARLDAVAAALGRHPGMADAVAALEPLVAERDRLQAQIEADKAALAAAEDAAIQALAIAKERAAQAAESDPNVLAAAAALQALQPKPQPDLVLVRGKIAIGKPDDAADSTPDTRPPQRRQQAPVNLASDNRPGSNYSPPLHS